MTLSEPIPELSVAMVSDQQGTTGQDRRFSAERNMNHDPCPPCRRPETAFW
jgi:hypothetical protein